MWEGDMCYKLWRTKSMVEEEPYETEVRVGYWGLSVDNDNWIVGRRRCIGGGIIGWNN